MAALGDLLVEDFVTGECSAVKVGQLARSAIQFCKAMGGQVPNDHPVQKLANIGSSGLHPSNSERDLQRRVKAMALHAKIEHVPVRINSPQQGHIIVKNIAVIFPDSMATALWEAGENIFRHFFFNGVNARKFWKHHGTHCEWFRRHVDYTYDKKSRLIPLSLYGDEVQTFKNTELLIFWASHQTLLQGMAHFLVICRLLPSVSTWSVRLPGVTFGRRWFRACKKW